jgi:hypothetical protein
MQYGAVPLPKVREERKTVSIASESAFQYDDDIARLPDLRNYRVVSVSTKPTPNRPNIYGPDLSMPALGTAARKPYIRLNSFANVNLARQFVWDFYESNKRYVDTNFVIRRLKDGARIVFQVDMGPFTSDRHAALYCSHVLNEKNKSALPCNVIKEFQTSSEKTAFKSTATVGLSASMVQQLLLSNKELDAPRLYGAAYDIEEGDTLGRNEFVVIKITQRGVHLVNDSGHMFLLPTDIIPLPAAADETGSN